MTPIVPSSTQPIADARGNVTTVWQRFFNALVPSSQAIETVKVGLSPFSYTASTPGALVISGGTVTSISLKRGTITVPTGQTSGSVPMANGDIVSVAFTSAPNIAFVPS